MNKKIFPAFLVLALVVGIFGIVSTINVLGDDAPTSAAVSNQAPVFTVTPAESWTQSYSGDATTDPRAESSSTYPTNEGTNLTITATATDANNDDYWMIICSSNVVSGGNNAAPSCGGTTHCTSSGGGTNGGSTAGTEVSCDITTTGKSLETYDWYAFVCDDQPIADVECLAAGDQGSGNSGSPFHVNHVDTNFGSLTIFDDGEDTTSTNYPDANGVALSSKTGTYGTSAYAITLDFTDTGTDCQAELPATLAALILGSSPNFTLDCDLDDSAGPNPVTGTLLAAAITDGTTTTIDLVVTAAAAGTGASAMTEGFAHLSTVSTNGIEPGVKLGFALTSALDNSDTISIMTDPDFNGTQDTITMYVCSGETTADGGDGLTTSFDYYDNLCYDGSSYYAPVCYISSIDPTGAIAGCAESVVDFVSVPAADTTYDILVYAEDAHDMPLNSVGTAGYTYTVDNIAPTLSSYTTLHTGSEDLTSPIGLWTQDSIILVHYVTLTDDNGDNDVTDMDFEFRDDVAEGTPNCTSDDNDCYHFDITNLAFPPGGCTTTPTGGSQTLSAAGSGKTALGTDQTLSLQCSHDVWYNANASTGWVVTATATDGGGQQVFADSSTIEVSLLQAMGITEGSINYGSLAIGQQNDEASVTTIQTDMENAGNSIFDVLLDGTFMCDDWAGQEYSTCPNNTIAVGQQVWNETNTWTWGTGDHTLVDTATTAGVDDETVGCLDPTLPARGYDHTDSAGNKEIYWKLKIPVTQITGTYTGQNTFATTANADCGNATPF